MSSIKFISWLLLSVYISNTLYLYWMIFLTAFNSINEYYTKTTLIDISDNQGKKWEITCYWT